MNYVQLIKELEKELGRPDWTSKLPELVRRAEDLLWSLVTGDWLEQSTSVETIKDQADYPVPELQLLIRPVRVLFNEEVELQLAPLKLKPDIVSSFDTSAEPEYVFLDSLSQTLTLTPPPDEDGLKVTVFGDFRDPYLTTSSDETTSRLLANCPDLLKFQVFLQIPDNRFQTWQQQFSRLLMAKRTIWTRQRKTGYVRQSKRRWI